MNATPLVAIQCMTYNHAPYIEDAMNGFCMQQTDFPFVAIIVDDASTDGEPDVIKRYLDQHFDMLNARQWETDEAHFIEAQHLENKSCWFAVVFLKYNFWQTKKQKDPLFEDWNNPAKYIALCEGDDYWTDSAKLQRQVDFLENNENIGLAYTIAQVYNEKSKTVIGTWGKETNLNCVLFEQSPIPTLSVLMRSGLYHRFRGILRGDPKWPLGDVPLWIHFIVFSKIHFLPITTGVYRLLEESESHSCDFYKRTNFISRAFLCRQYYANKFVNEQTTKKVALIRIQNLLHQSFLYNKRLNLPLIKNMIESRILNPKIFVLIILSKFRLGRKVVNTQRNLRVKNRKKVTNYFPVGS